jgi:hypothetical protein
MSDRISQLQPFNEHRFDDCIAYLAAKHDRPLTVYEMMKLHVMIDVYHTLDRGTPVIGGTIWPFTNGPVSRSSKSRVSQWQKQYEMKAQMPDGFLVIDEGDRLRVKPARIPDDEDFSESELAAMHRAWGDVVELLDKNGFLASQAFFHCDGFIGRAWKKARSCGQNLNWNDIIDEYHAEHSDEDHSRIKALLRI